MWLLKIQSYTAVCYMFGNAALEYAGDVSSLGLRTAHIEKPCNTAHTLSCFGAV